MLRIQERGGWVDEAAVAAPDHAFLHAVLEGLTFYTGSVFYAVWHHEIRLDAAKHLRVRRKQKLQLSRYGRQPFLSREWDDVESLVHLFGPVKGNNFAKAGLEMACWDLLARREGLSMATSSRGASPKASWRTSTPRTR